MHRISSLILAFFISAPLQAQPPKACREAYVLAQKDQYTKALDQLKKKKCPQDLIDYIKWRELKYPENNATFKEHFDFIHAHPRWPFLSVIRKNMVQKEPKGVSDQALVRLFKDSPPTTVDGITLYAKILNRQKKSNLAAQKIRTFWTNRILNKEDAGTFLKTHANVLRPQDHHKRLEFLLWGGKADLAEPLVKYLPKEKALIAKTRIALLQNKPKVFKTLMKKIPKSQLTNEGLLYDQVVWRRRYKEKEGIDLYQQVRKHIDTHLPYWAKQKHIIVRDAIRLKNYEKAYRLVSSHQFKSGKLFAEAEWLAGFVAYRFLKKDQAAVKHFTRLLEKLKKPMGLAQAAYWGSLALKRMGNNKKRIAWLKKGAAYPMTYYGQLCCEALGRKNYLNLKKAPSIKKALKQKIEKHPFAKIVKLLDQLERPTEALPFLFLLFKRVKNDQERLAVIDFAHRYSPENVIELVGLYNGPDTLMYKMAYPILKGAQWRKGLDKALVHAIIRKESGFNPHVTSHRGAIGLIQVMPPTGKEIATQLKLKAFKPNDLYDEKVNLKIGQVYIDQMLKKYDSKSLPLSLAAYNAGFGNVSFKWLPKFGDPRTDEIDDMTWIELIPFGETRFYIRKILASHKIYQNLLRT